MSVRIYRDWKEPVDWLEENISPSTSVAVMLWYGHGWKLRYDCEFNSEGYMIRPYCDVSIDDPGKFAEFLLKWT